MQQVFQDLRTGQTRVEDCPVPAVHEGQVLVRTAASVVSAGTERMLVEFGQASLVAKARQQPERVREALDKARTEGVAATSEAIRSRLDEPVALGYASAGIVIDVGDRVEGFEVGQRVASNGPHAEVASVPANLCAAIPGDDLPDEECAFATLGAVALHGVRLAGPELGGRVAVTGLGLVGLLAVQLLRAHGCQVLASDLDASRLKLARRFGADVVHLSRGEDPVAAAHELTGGRGVDAVVVAASASSSEPLRQAAEMSRRLGRIVLVGVAPIEFDRKLLYDKELTFQVSRSYGPGRYDPAYEERGVDYPFEHVRWTAQRNMDAFVRMLAEGRVEVALLITHRFPVDQAPAAYDALLHEDALGIVLEYPRRDDEVLRTEVVVRPLEPSAGPARGVVAAVGAGNFARRTLFPALADTPAVLHTVVSRGGASAAQAARTFGFHRAATDLDAVLADPAVDTLVVTTRHDSHADLVLRGLRAGKHVLVEKPLVVRRSQLDEIRDTYQQLVEEDRAPLLMVGLNRRFAPLTVRLRELLASVAGPKTLVATVNAGPLPRDHWTQDPDVGGGRILGEAVHFVDLLRHLAGHPIADVHATFLDSATRDSATVTLRFGDGSTGTVHYLATGHRRFPKERVEVFGGGRVLVLDNFRSLTGYGVRGVRSTPLAKPDKGHARAVAAFVDAVRSGGPPPIPFHEIVEVHDATLRAAEAAWGR